MGGVGGIENQGFKKNEIKIPEPIAKKQRNIGLIVSIA
jgi:hypothetical protein